MPLFHHDDGWYKSLATRNLTDKILLEEKSHEEITISIIVDHRRSRDLGAVRYGHGSNSVQFWRGNSIKLSSAPGYEQKNTRGPSAGLGSTVCRQKPQRL